MRQLAVFIGSALGLALLAARGEAAEKLVLQNDLFKVEWDTAAARFSVSNSTRESAEWRNSTCAV